ncbi:Protein of unknown function [Marinobacter persicus]|uniref:DUF2868 domain-containing protein n=1 Tax=Marinobacter persicus TaxID=930118 RepID=A0A1I3V899_9GAMM|nr:DUF2868 domain-containing protein [Marinobacter persicus]GHD41540.1 hypothetical protein GCM10008110_03760 [Marinobacter persicus]SFJ91183.1 Protein of unknown function [Marinobacter persicus]
MTDKPLRLLLAFDDRFQRDRDQPATFLHRRDRRFALDCQQQGRSPGIRAWLAHLDRLSGAGADRSQTPGSRYLQRWRALGAGFIAGGSLLGVAAMLGLLLYEGGQRINVTVFLAFVMLQLLLAVVTTVQAAAGWQPWHWLTRHWQTTEKSPVRTALQPPMAARAAQAGGLAFATSGLITLLIMVVIQDLAFGWSTTLDTASTSYHRLVSSIAAPWAWLWPAAVPSLELVEATRFFRAAPDAATTSPPQWGQWWPFLTMTWLTWTWLPRLALLLATHFFLQHRARRLLARHPGLTTLHYRMETPVIETGNQHSDADDLPDTRTRSELASLPVTPVCIAWAGAGRDGLPEELVPTSSRPLSVGGNARLEDDDAVLQATRQQLQQQSRPQVLLLTRSWQPPTGELSDFLEQARQHWPAGTRVTLVPLAADPGLPPADHLLQPWLRFAGRLSGFASVATVGSTREANHE